MTKQEAMGPNQKEQVEPVPQAQPPQEQVPKPQKKETVTPEELKEMYRRLGKTRSVLHTAGDIEVGQTPCELLHETRTYRLVHYQQMVNKTERTPILIVYALINKSYVLDLQPDKSWVKSLLSQGFDVYLLDWKSPTNADKFVSFDDYVNCYIDECVDIVLKKSKVDKLTLHGYCMGASMSAMYTTLHQEKVRNLVVIAPVVDTEKDTTVIG
ncbi:MAG TPA: alpha/beta fold hydrolase, partial [Nitrososphaera sp.]|nr:alpha/beta fold hydrolase [Nitrososphaera sp.]